MHSLSLEGELGPGETESIAVSGFGYVAAVTVFLHFENTQQDMTRASDLSIIVEAPDGTCKQIGGFDVDFGCTSSGFWPSSWQSTADGDYVGSSDNWKCARRNWQLVRSNREWLERIRRGLFPS